MRYYATLLLTALLLVGCNDETKVRRVSLSPDRLRLEVGEQYQIEMIVMPLSSAIYNPKAWRSSDPTVAEVDSRGNVTALRGGECVITGQAAHIEGQCSLRVVVPRYKFTMSQGVIFNQGVEDDKSANHLIVRLHNEDLEINDNGETYGNGVFLNLSLYSPITDDKIALGDYTTTADVGTEYSIEPGELLSEDGTYYATGSYLGQYTNDGLIALFLINGIVTVTNDGEYLIECKLEGEENEQVSLTYKGEPRYVNISTTEPVKNIYYTHSTEQKTTLVDETQTALRRITFYTTTDTTITLTARLPLTTATLPIGTYRSSDDKKPFTLIDTHQTSVAAICTSTDTTAIESAVLKVYSATDNGIEAVAAITDYNHTQYIMSPIAEKGENICKTQLATDHHKNVIHWTQQ